MTIKKLVTCSVALSAVLILSACGGSDPNDENHINGMDSTMALVLCKKNAERQLQNPGDAKWQSVTSAEMEKSDDGGQWGIRTYVDADGARKNVWCTVRPQDEKTADVEAILL